MGIVCEISLCKPADDKYTFQPGSTVAGEIRYILDKEYEFSLITVSLRGYGKLYFENRARNRRDRQNKLYNTETYIDEEKIIYKNENKELLPVGRHEAQFSFQLPFDIPASIKYTKHTASDYALCTIQYYILIQFENRGWFQFNKYYKKEINVISGQTPRMTMAPLIYGDQKKLLQIGTLFSNKKGIVNLKATIANSVLRPKESVKVDYEIENDTNLEIKRVETRLLEVDTYFVPDGRNVKVQSEIQSTGFLFGAIQSGDTAKFTAELIVPSLCSSLDHSKIISRDYSVLTSVVLPIPHDNIQLEIPFQVINRLSSSFRECSSSNFTAERVLDDAPPSYWEVMAEENKESTEEEPTF